MQGDMQAIHSRSMCMWSQDARAQASWFTPAQTHQPAHARTHARTHNSPSPSETDRRPRTIYHWNRSTGAYGPRLLAPASLCTFTKGEEVHARRSGRACGATQREAFFPSQHLISSQLVFFSSSVHLDLRLSCPTQVPTNRSFAFPRVIYPQTFLTSSRRVAEPEKLLDPDSPSFGTKMLEKVQYCSASVLYRMAWGSGSCQPLPGLIIW
ncbi:hypothetical protein BDZ45DRAFT_91014 [Acephala macrosclerotiorum]|nr:hypothetical protein BDZ45DRAFT_91014 [Acephala macrosclerotiorum]